jgi:superfamily II DNA or RNA helicase
LEVATLTPCSDLRIETLTPAGKRSSASDWYVENDRVYYRANLDDTVLLENINLHFALQLDEGEKNAILEHRKREDIERKCAAIRSESTLASRLVKAVGVKKIRKHLPVGLANAVESDLGRLTPEQTAELAFATYGVDALREFRDDLSAAGLDPPNRWAGGNQAVEFASSLGFGKEFAGFESARREPLLEIEGPPRLPKLHDFQETICEKLKRIVLSSDSSRGLLCLPTGAGKTRVVVQALIESIKEDTLQSPIVWIAQSDELCEQAVRAWSDCWRALGDRRVLSLSRLWSTNRAHAIDTGPHVVVATIQKLNSCIGELAYKWLQKCSCIVVDEAHGATTPEYTNVLRVLGIDFSSREEKQDRCPLVGMTATPFRGHSEDETKRLVGRFGGNRLDLAVLGQDPYAKLQETGVLARVDHRLIDGSEMSLSEEEEVELKRFQRLPATVEERLGADHNRNRSLIDSIQSLERFVGPGWTAILFAASVQHAQVMAAMLNFSGIRAAAVSYDTDAGARRHYVEKFRTGEISVLANYGVLTQGFDAPSVRAIYVARPTFSPNVYQQMIGRGLRGPKNGGKERCLIVNVRDNLERYGLTLAFRHFEHLWKGVE